jgi:MFS family permease
MGRGGVQIMLIILLQGIWLPLHGYSYSSTPFWSGVFIIPMMLGFVVMGPLSGRISDRHGARGLATLGMVITAGSFILLATLPYNFVYWEFAVILFVMGIGGGLFASPNTVSIMNAAPAEDRGAASGMRATLQNVGQTASTAIFFTIMLAALSGTLPSALSSAAAGAGAPQLATAFTSIPPTSALFAAFLGYNPVKSILQNPVLAQQASSLPASVITNLTGLHFFPTAIAPAFMTSLQAAFYIAAALSMVAAVASVLRGKRGLIQKVPLAERIQREIPRPPVPVATVPSDSDNEDVKQ